MDLNNLLAIARSYKGKVTYSMTGSRNMSDGTADCSGFISTILKQAGNGGAFNGSLFSTVSLPIALAKSGWTRIVTDDPKGWEDQLGDIVIWSDGNSTADSGGAGGHVMLMTGSNTGEISCDYSTGGAAGTAVQEYNYDQYFGWNDPNYYEVWRYNVQPSTVQPLSKPVAVTQAAKVSAIQAFKNVGNKFAFNKSIKVDAVKFANGIWQFANLDLAGGSPIDWNNNGIPLAIVDRVDGGDNNNVGVGAIVQFNQAYRTGTIDSYDDATQAVGIDYAGYGRIWYSADALANRF